MLVVNGNHSRALIWNGYWDYVQGVRLYELNVHHISQSENNISFQREITSSMGFISDCYSFSLQCLSFLSVYKFQIMVGFY